MHPEDNRLSQLYAQAQTEPAEDDAPEPKGGKRMRRPAEDRMRRPQDDRSA